MVACRAPGHIINWKGLQVVDRIPDFYQRCILEAWHIQKKPHDIKESYQIYYHLTHPQADDGTHHHPSPCMQPTWGGIVG